MNANTPHTHTRTKGDIRTPLGVILTQNGKPIDLSGLTVTVVIEQVDGDAEQVETSTGVTAHPTYTFTADTSGDYIVRNGHPVKEHDQIVVSNSGGALPTGLAASTRYFAREVEDNGFKVAARRNGTAIDLTGAGTGTHSFYIVGSVQYDFASANVNEAGDYYLWFIVTESGEDDHFPHDGKKLMVTIVDTGEG
jgi:hypothetical protein